MSQFNNKTEAKSYERNRIEALERETKVLEKAKTVMNQEDYENYSSLILDGIPTIDQMELEIKYGFVKRENCMYWLDGGIKNGRIAS